MLLDCLKDFIGFRGCFEIEPKSGLYIQDLEGLSYDMLAALNPKDKFDNVADFVSSKIRMAGLELIDSIKKEINTLDLSFTSVLTSENLGSVCSTRIKTECKKFCITSNEVSTLVCPVINSITLYHKKYECKETIICIENCGEIEEIKVKLQGTKTFLPVDIIIQGEFKIWWKDTGIDVYKVNLPLRTTNVNHTNCGCGVCGICCSDDVVTLCYDTKDICTEGIAVNIVCKCCIENLLCNCLNELKLALLYRVGVLIVRELSACITLDEKYSSVISFLTPLARIEYGNYDKPLKGAWIERYEGIERSFLNQLKPFIENLDDNCIECESMFEEGWIL